MATATRVSLEEYLRTEYKPSCELIDGELRRKPMGTFEHMDMERKLIHLLERFEKDGLGRAVHELSIRRGGNVLIPDVVFAPPEATFVDGVLVTPPLLCVEILSPSQRLSELVAKCEEYHGWEVPYCWVIDPIRQTAWEYHRSGTLRQTDETLAAGGIAISLKELFGKDLFASSEIS